MSEIVLLGDAIGQLRSLDAESINTCVTSPPYYNLRNYGVDGQIGMEETPEAYIEKLVAVFREVRRVLRQDGTLWVNIGDSYATRSGKQPPTNTRNSCGHTEKRMPEGYKYKDLMGVPWMLAFALREDGWYLRQDIIWHKTNCMPESVRDRCTKSHEYIFLLSKSERYYFDAEAISEPIAGSSTKRYLQNIEAQQGSAKSPGKTNGNMKAALPKFGRQKYGDSEAEETRTKSGKTYVPTMRRNKRDVWTTSTSSFRGAHFAVFPEKLIEPCILAGCPAGGTVLDPNITACKDKRELFRQYRETGALIDFNQGLDIRLLNDADIADMLEMRLKNVHFAWDDPKADLAGKFEWYTKAGKKAAHGRYGTVFCLTNFNSTMEENLYRVYTLRDLGYDPYVMIYDKPNAPKEIKRLQRWVNNKIIFRATKKFEEYDDRRG